MINVCVLRLKSEKFKKDYNFNSISNAALFEKKIKSCDESKSIKIELLYKELNHTNYLMQELAKDPVKYAEKEYYKWFNNKGEVL